MKPYEYGDPITSVEFAEVRARVAPKLSRKGRRTPWPILLVALHNALPNRLEHEVNRLRGFAFDSGECGFSHAVIMGGK